MNVSVSATVMLGVNECSIPLINQKCYILCSWTALKTFKCSLTMLEQLSNKGTFERFCLQQGAALLTWPALIENEKC